MEFFTLKRHIEELKNSADRPAILDRAIDLPQSGVGLVLKTSSGWQCCRILLSHENQGFWFSPNIEESPKESNFVRTLNRHLCNARLKDISLYESIPGKAFDRICRLSWVVKDRFFGEKSSYYLIIELTGRISNLLLCDDQFSVVDQFRATNNNRPKASYTPPPVDSQAVPPSNIDFEKIGEIFSGPPASWREKILGLSPTLCREISFRLKVSSETKPIVIFQQLMQELSGPGSINLYHSKGKVASITPALLKHLEPTAETMRFGTVNEAMEWTDRHIISSRLLEELRSRVNATYSKTLAFKEKCLRTQQELISNYEDCGRLRHLGELILCHIHEIKPRVAEAHLIDWTNGDEVTVALEPLKTPAQNAQRYFHRYKKALRGKDEACKRAKEIESEISWLKEQMWFCQTAEKAADLLGLAYSLDKAGKPKKSQLRNVKEGKSLKPLLEIDGCKFYVGRNGRQNDIITFKIGKKGDVWLHANDMPGAHVIAKKAGGIPNDNDIIIGAVLAAHFSFAKNSGKAAVDWTDVANVRRIPGGGCGRVSYVRQKTVFIDPTQALSLLSPITGEK